MGANIPIIGIYRQALADRPRRQSSCAENVAIAVTRCTERRSTSTSPVTPYGWGSNCTFSERFRSTRWAPDRRGALTLWLRGVGDDAERTARREGGQVRVLVVEDERMLADSLAEGLRQEAFAVDVVYDGDAALERLAVNDYDVVVLDRDLPVVHGDDVCRTLVESGASARVIMLTASGEVADRIAGLRLGADDYLPKPFSFDELVARVHALGRRCRLAYPPTLERAGLRLDPARREVFRDGHYVALARKEFLVLAELLRAGGAVVSAEQLLEKAWDENIDPFTNTVRMTIMKLRRKLGSPQVIETVPGGGYRIA
jgi:DNA-binding response OmpR family regulator